jgi:CheY-like chemotaxis protein
MARRSRTTGPIKQTREFEPLGPGGAKPVILVVDDDWDICDAAKETLDEAGFETVCVSNGELALRHLGEHAAPAAIVLDLMMPVMDGWKFVERVRALPHLRDIPIVVLTAAGPHWGYPVQRVLRKPIGRSELVAALRAVVHASDRGTPPEHQQPAADAPTAQAIEVRRRVPKRAGR